MKKQFETPVIKVNWFCVENIVTTSGAENNVTNMQVQMEQAGYAVTTKSLLEFTF